MSTLPINELSSTAFNWLKSLGLKIDKKFLYNELTTHQDYPAVSSLADFLDKGNMEYVVAEADATYINEFKYPLLAHVKDGKNGEGLIPVSNSDIWSKTPLLTEAWTGVVLMPGNNAKWENTQHTQSLKESSLKKITYAVVTLLLLINTIWITSFAATWQETLFIAVSFLGVIVSWVTFEADLGIQNQFVKQVCDSVSPKAGCNSVLKSKQSKTVYNASIADLGLAWFISQYLLLTIAYILPGLTSLKWTIFQCSLLGFGVAGWSIYTQKFIIKQWCALCLGVASLVFLQALLSIFLVHYQFDFIAALIIACTLLVVFTVAVLPLKSILKQTQKFNQLGAQLKKWKQDLNIFLALWQGQKIVPTEMWENELIMGDRKAPLQLTVACNPYCGPCANAHKKMERWVHHYSGKIALRIRFTINADNEHDAKVVATKLILQESLKKTNDFNFINDWYEWMNIDQWKLKYQPDESMDVKLLL